MTLPVTPAAYAAEYDAFDQAIADPKGARVHCGTYPAALNFRFRLNYARRLDREKTKTIYAPGDPGYGISAFDSIVCRIKQDTLGDWWVYLEKNETVGDRIESLSGE